VHLCPRVPVQENLVAGIGRAGSGEVEEAGERDRRVGAATRGGRVRVKHDARTPVQELMNRCWGQSSIFADDEVTSGVERLLVCGVMPLLDF